MSDVLTLWLSVPITGLRPMRAREYQETYPAPPPSTVYGMLLSLVGIEREHKHKHIGLRIALALAENGEGSLWQRQEKGRVLRKFRRIAQSDRDADLLADRRPDYQELLLGLEFWLWIDDSRAKHPLSEEIRKVLDPERRGEITRHGGLSLGESSHLIDEITERRPRGKGRFVSPSEEGFLSMPVWSERIAIKGRSPQSLLNFEIGEPEELLADPPSDCWITIAPR